VKTGGSQNIHRKYPEKPLFLAIVTTNTDEID